MAGTRQWEALFEEQFEGVYAYVAYRVWPAREAARDITQEVFLAAWKRRREFRGEASGLSWVRGIARNKVADYFRARGKVGDEIGVDELVIAPVVEYEAERRVMVVGKVLKSLPENYARLLEEKYLEGYSVEAMARGSGMSEKAVESALSRARGAFREAYSRVERQVDCEECSDGNR